jgi:hypothetical protein
LKKVIAVLLAALFALSFVPFEGIAAQGGPQVQVSQHYTVHRYGWATLNETVTYTNSGTAAVATPDIQLGFGNLTGRVATSTAVGGSFTSSLVGSGSGAVFEIGNGNQPIAAGASVSFTFDAIITGVGSDSNGSLYVEIVEQPSVNVQVSTLRSSIQMPTSTSLAKAPTGFSTTSTGSNYTYTGTFTNYNSTSATIRRAAVTNSTGIDYFPLTVAHASRTISVNTDGTPVVQDSITFTNGGATKMTKLYVKPLEASSGSVTIVPSDQPPLVASATVKLSGGAISLTVPGVGVGVAAGDNYTITFDYALASQYYTKSGSTVSIALPSLPPIEMPVKSYDVTIQSRPGVNVLKDAPGRVENANPFVKGTIDVSYQITFGWALDSSVPLGSLLFALTLSALFITGRSKRQEAEEEESASDTATPLIKAFEEKSGVIESMFEEVEGADASTANKVFFDDLRSRYDAFRSRAMQRLNEAKQASTSRRLTDLLGQLNEREREVDRAAKDMLNLYEQRYSNRMRDEVYNRLRPSYRKRMDKTLDQLSDVLNSVQREAKLL